MSRFLQVAVLLLAIVSCRQQNSARKVEAKSNMQTTGSIEVLSPEMTKYVNPNAKVEIIAEGFDWSEGPLWLPEQKKLIFSDVPANMIYQWSESGGVKAYLTPSGYTEDKPRGGETGSNGLLLDPKGRLVLCQHGDRRMARMDAPLDKPAARFVTLAGDYKGQRFNSPNDATYNSNGDLYFTDPPYGLEKMMTDPAKEIPFQGVYRLSKKGDVELLTRDMSRPNGIAFSPDENTLYVANSDPDRPIWMAYDVQEDGSISNGRVFFDATELAAQNRKGLPDGLKVAKDGTLFATGPGGVLIIDRSGRHLGTIETGQATSNCAFNEDHSTLFITADNYLMRISLVTHPGDK